jgi:hypothetical protein
MPAGSPAVTATRGRAVSSFDGSVLSDTGVSLEAFN